MLSASDFTDELHDKDALKAQDSFSLRPSKNLISRLHIIQMQVKS